MFWLLYALTGAVAGALAGLMGIGGGLVMVPALLLLFSWQDVPSAELAHHAIATSLSAIIPIALTSLLAHQKKRAIDWRSMRLLTPGLVLGALTGAALASRLSTPFLQGFFALFLLLVAVQIYFNRLPQTAGKNRRQRSLLPFAGFAIGHVSALIGIGGGTMTVPLLAWLGKPLPQAIATSAACGLPIALAGSLGFMLTGNTVSDFIHWKAATVMALFAVFTAPWGAHWAHHLPVSGLRKMFALILVLVSLRLLFSSISATP